VDRASGTHAGLDVTGVAPHDGSALVDRLAEHLGRVPGVSAMVLARPLILVRGR
jgi:hypothetical protein